MRDVKRPSIKMSWVDATDWEVNASAANYTTMYGLYGETWNGSPAVCMTCYRHTGTSANMIFFDGHVEGPNWQIVYKNAIDGTVASYNPIQ